jgi:hypothetical protein
MTKLSVTLNSTHTLKYFANFVFLCILLFIIFGCSTNEEVKQLAIHRTRTYLKNLDELFSRDQKAKDIKVHKVEKGEVANEDRAHGVTAIWNVTIKYIYYDGKWKDGNHTIRIIKRNGKLTPDN